VVRTLWNGISFLAVVNLLALLMVGTWLWRSGRLDRDRVLEIKGMLATPIAEVAAAEDEAAKAAEAEAEAARARPVIPAVDSIARNAQFTREGEQERLLRRRLADEQQLLVAQLDTRMQDLASLREQVGAGAQTGGAAAAAERQRREGEQFSKAVKQMESIPAAQAKRILRGMIDGGQMQQAVAYLNAMQPRAASKVLREFKTEEETAVARELIEQLRQFGGEGTEGLRD
jgi:hypothetical protein